MANQGDIFQVTIFQDYLGEECLNVFYYGQATTGTTTSAGDLRDEFLADVWTAVRGVQRLACHTNRIRVINGMNNNDAVDTALDLDGLAGDVDGFPAHVAVACRSPKGTPGLRYSYKRFVGAPNDLTANGEWGTTVRDAIVAMTDNLGNAIESAAGLYSPVQIKPDPNADPPRPAWKLGFPPILARGLSGTWQYNRIPSHQDSRQQFNWQIS